MSTRIDQTKISILKALHEIGRPAGASRILEHLSGMGVGMQPRTVRFYLLQLDREGMTRFVSRRQGREMTDRGREELVRANVMEKVGFIAAKVDTLGYRMSLRVRDGCGTIVTNVAFVDRRVESVAFKEMARVFGAGLSMGQKIVVAHEGQTLGGLAIPGGSVAIGTVCSVTLNGIMLHEGIPVTSRFGGLLEMRDGRPTRFVELIEYAGTTLDPLEAFIRAGMTTVRSCARTGSGIVGASFREIPSAAIDDAIRIHKAMKRHGLGGIVSLGKPNQPLLDVPVGEGRAGMIVIGGLNPVAAVHEAGIRLSMLSLAGLQDFGSFVPYAEALGDHE